jgi:hypothetical protein
MIVTFTTVGYTRNRNRNRTLTLALALALALTLTLALALALALALTLTQVGYGDMYPESKLGKIVTVLAILCGVIFMAMPVSVASVASVLGVLRVGDQELLRLYSPYHPLYLLLSTYYRSPSWATTSPSPSRRRRSSPLP